MKATTVLFPLFALATAMSCRADLKFDRSTVELKAKPSDEQLEAQFTFKNTGASAVEITDLEISCSCLSASADQKTYAPGASGKLDVEERVDVGQGLFGPPSRQGGVECFSVIVAAQVT